LLGLLLQNAGANVDVQLLAAEARWCSSDGVDLR
jgi:hypothetical protein